MSGKFARRRTMTTAPTLIVLVALLGFMPATLIAEETMPNESQASLEEFGPEVAAMEEPAPVARDPREIRRGIPMGGREGKSREQIYYERVIAKVEPGLKGSPDRLPLYVELFKRELINDVRLFPVEVEATWIEDEGLVRLEGHLLFERNREALHKLLQYLGFEELDDRIEILPSKSLGEKKFAFVTAPNAFTVDADGETMTQALMGDQVYLLKEGEEGKYLCLSSEGYVGYIDADKIERVDAQAFSAYQQLPTVTVLKDWKKDDLFIPTGARLRASGETESPAGVEVKLPDGRTVTLPREIVEIKAAGPHPDASDMVDTAAQYIGTRYVWGGNSTEGIDCSGLIQSSYRAQGIHYPRDADQQIYLGSLVATNYYRDNLQKGDTLYFLGGRNGRVTHTGVYVGDGIWLEATGPVVKYTSFNPEDENYDEARDRGFAFGKRLLE